MSGGMCRNGRWRSSWEVTTEGDTGEMIGKVTAEVHYYEEGNVQVFRGTAIAKAVAMRSAEGRMMSVAGGGDTLAALANAGVSDQFSYISTAGGAFLEWLEGKTLPGVEALRMN